jgi:hypothetical protein
MVLMNNLATFDLKDGGWNSTPVGGAHGGAAPAAVRLHSSASWCGPDLHVSP